jgi:glucose-6-phosphate isomerase
MIKINTQNTTSFYSIEEHNQMTVKAIEAHQTLTSKTGKGNDFLGWLDLPIELTSDFLQKIKSAAHKLSSVSEIIVVTGIGGSYLGARAVIEALGNNLIYLQDTKKRPLIIYAGHNISEDYLADLLQLLDKKEYSVVVISKSGTTTEPALAFRILKSHCEQKYGKKEATSRIVAITDESKGALLTLAKSEGYPTFVIPDDVGGRFSVLTPVGLLPIAAAGFDIDALVKGAQDMRELCLDTKNVSENVALQYAITRNLLYNKGFNTEILANYQPTLVYFSEWWKQLYGESEGKEHKGIFPASVTFSSDLHSMGQYIQQGERHLFETMLWVEKANAKVAIPHDPGNLDGLNFLAEKSIHEINKNAFFGTTLAHVDGGVPVIHLTIPQLSAYYIGQLIYFYEFACAISGYMIDVNPFDQPGVEDYKRNMFALLGKPGYEELNKELTKRI